MLRDPRNALHYFACYQNTFDTAEIARVWWTVLSEEEKSFAERA